MGVKYNPDSECTKKGSETENLFLEVLRRKDSKAFISNLQEDSLNHIDIITSDGKSYDVKSRKKTSRANKETQDDLIWIEYQNVRGFRGWLFGDADYVVFERKKDFVVIPRKDLIKVCKILVNDKRFVVESKYALYKMYQRKGRKDLLTMIKMSDILGLDSVEIMEK